MSAIENVISSAIVRSFTDKLLNHLEVDVAMVGAGPSALVAAFYLAKAGKKVAVFERKLAPGGGTWGGGMLFNEVVVQSDATAILDDLGITYREIETAPGYFTLDSVEMASALIYSAVHAGAKIFNAMSVEDIIFKGEKVGGLVVNWTPVERLGMHVDPLTVVAKAVLDGTGHPSEIMNLAVNKAQIKLDTPTGKILGERPMWVDSGEASTIENTKEYFPGLFACGMSANNCMGGYRMGPIFGGMLMSGKKVAGLIQASLEK
ncbi:MAG: sulfide-dependent adenosine diphosphate thiazole synthase [Thermoguttaceae bacterium]|nr:thiazole biosynthesis protein [Thermoguttaceae bacterium]MDO4856738.1 sulfide-dependent adenosine diphosphate thiazole synthase [Thermoguttaceae bacterium]